MKKSLSLLLILLTIFSTVSLPAYAAVDESVQAVYDALTEEMLTTDNEPAVSVTKSLNTDLSEDISLPDGVSISFASSDTTVITDDGAVNRPLNSKAQVTLTATISKSGSDSLTKQLSFTVLPQTSEVLASENFYYPSLVNRDLVSWDSTNNQAVLAVPNWTISDATAAKLENDITAKLLKDSNGYYNATTTRINKDSYAAVAYLQYRAAGLPAVIQQPDDRFVTLTVNLNPVSWGSTTTKQFYILVEGQDASGSKNATYLQFWSDRTRVCDSAGSKLFESQNHVVSTNQNNKIEVKLDYNNKLVNLYLNDELVTPDGVSMTDTNYIRQINNVSIGYYRGMTGAVMQVNDFTLTKETAYCVASPQGVTAEMLACGQDPAFITEDLTMPANSEITWTSDNPSVIAADGTVTRPAAEDAVVTLTATDGASSNSIAFTVKAMTVSSVAINDSFNAPFYDAGLCNQPHPSFTATSTATASATYKNVGADYYLDYATTSTYASSQVTYTQTTGTAFPVGNSGKYIFAFDACFDNTAQTLFSFMGNGVNAVRFNNSKGALKVSNSSNEWYNDDNKTYATITAGKWYDVKLVIDTLAETPSFTLYFDGSSVASSTLISGSAFDASIGMNIRTRDNASGAAFGVKIDNFKLYTESTPDEAIKSMSNADKASYFAKLISESTVTTEKSYSIENDLLLTAPYAAFDLDEMGVAITWSSSDPSVISSTGSVSRQENNRYVVMKAFVTAGSGEDAVTVTKELLFTVGAADSTIFRNYNYDFESDTIDSVPGNWTVNTSSTSVTAQAPGRSGKALKAVFTGSGTASTTSVTAGALDKRYFISADVNFNTENPATGAYFVLNGAGITAKIGMRFSDHSVLVVQDNNLVKNYMAPDITIMPDTWYHIDIDFNAAKKAFTAYVNGKKIFDEPVDIADNIWAGWYHIRQVGIAFDGAGTGYIDNVIIRESNGSAPVYDENSDYTVRSISLTNQSGKTITDIASTTTKVVARVKLLANRTAQDGETKIFFARYNTEGMLEDIVPQTVTITNKGLIAKLEMPLQGDCTGHGLKVFVMNADTLVPICHNLSTDAPKFDTERLFTATPNVTPALALGYDAESGYEGIEAILYDGDTYKGRPVKHFAYIGLPEGASAENPVPAVVCVHGGGGSAFDEWVKKWNDAGYAAIAMNLNGRIPSDTISNGNNQLRHAWPGATQDNYSVVSPNDETWMYSAVTAVIAAHNVLRGMPEVDNNKIGITGVSWGGVVTSTVIGVDNRFAFAIPSYGCGFLYGSETYMAQAMTEEKKSWDPSSFIQNASLPILWMNGDRDGNFSLTSTTKSAELAGDNSYVAIIPNFAHNHSATWNRPECYAFADSIVKNGTAFIRGSVEVNGSQATVTTSRSAVSATMYYSTDNKLSYTNGTSADFSYTALSNSASNTDTFTFEIPSDAKRFYIVFKDENNYNTSTTLIELNR